MFPNVPDYRRKGMRANKSKNTAPEVAVRRLLHGLGYRYRLHRKDLPGKPDIVFAGRRKVIEVRGCFWHGHQCPRFGHTPKSRLEYWKPKIAGNRARDARNVAALVDSGWEVLELWECEVKSEAARTTQRLINFLGGNQAAKVIPDPKQPLAVESSTA